VEIERPRNCMQLKMYVNERAISKVTDYDFCLTVHHQLGKVIQKDQLDATMIY